MYTANCLGMGPTTANTFIASFVDRSESWNAKYSDQTSPEYKQLSEKYMSALIAAFFNSNRYNANPTEMSFA